MHKFVLEYFDVNILKQMVFCMEIIVLLYLMTYAVFLLYSRMVEVNELFEAGKKKKLRNTISHDYYVPISVIVPAGDEAATVVETVKSLFALNYKIYEIIVVNDGAKNEIEDMIVKNFGLKRSMRPICIQIPCKEVVSIYKNGTDSEVSLILINKKNGGKADSINMGINASTYPYYVCMEADDILEKDGLKKLSVPILENQDVVAVASKVHIGRKGRLALFKKDAVIRVGGCNVLSGEETGELIKKLQVNHRSHKSKYKIKYIQEAVCWKQAPEGVRDLWESSKGRERRALFIQLLGLLITVLSCILNVIDVKAMLIFFIVYVSFRCVLWIMAIVARNYLTNIEGTCR